MMLLALMFAYSGLAGLSLGMERHYRHVWRKPAVSSTTLALRIAGGCCIIAALLCCLLNGGGTIAVLTWIGLLSLAALLLVPLLAYAPRAAVVLAMLALITGILACVYR